mmetsp:Transcript_1283/g.3119  ORF Transcript_1283/g.3119 Transcript_1283/m.3119 type:complete len:372 (+) Transcript_1283:1796-2911(+)
MGAELRQHLADVRLRAGLEGILQVPCQEEENLVCDEADGAQGSGQAEKLPGIIALQEASADLLFEKSAFVRLLLHGGPNHGSEPICPLLWGELDPEARQRPKEGAHLVREDDGQLPSLSSMSPSLHRLEELAGLDFMEPRGEPSLRGNLIEKGELRRAVVLQQPQEPWEWLLAFEELRQDWLDGVAEEERVLRHETPLIRKGAEHGEQLRRIAADGLTHLRVEAPTLSQQHLQTGAAPPYKIDRPEVVAGAVPQLSEAFERPDCELGIHDGILGAVQVAGRREDPAACRGEGLAQDARGVGLQGRLKFKHRGVLPDRRRELRWAFLLGDVYDEAPHVGWQGRLHDPAGDAALPAKAPCPLSPQTPQPDGQS